ncbi:glycoside hydrolase family 27 protein [Hanamia caeni]|uniref:Alpha-galactosidase n=2 Tax=Hanamia caeni TaxID=2294116 RepID=A0A3M9NES9_9BACT|nr:glycoside hydrolase family 27 protein [Hanamia caeni]
MPINKKSNLNMNKKYFAQYLLLLVFFLSPSSIKAQQNGLALTPPMGWSSWYPFVDTINEKKIMETADAMVSTGLRDLGYTILQLDDGWMAKTRDENGRQFADKKRFPHGLKFLADYLHARGLKLGIYSSAGATTCAGYPGSYGHEELDAKTYASWGIDYLKYDACGNKEGHSDKELFTRMGNALKATGRPVIFNLCIFYSDTTHLWGAALGNTWRTGGDIVKFIEKNPEVTYQNWYSTLETQVLGKEKYAGPGHWNDPDNLIVGYARNNKQTLAEQQAQFSFWSLLAAPLFLGNDVRNMPPEIKKIITNKEVIAINQDKEGKQGTRIVSEKNYEIWVKPLSDEAKAVILFNKTNSSLKIQLKKNDLDMQGKLKMRDLWRHANQGLLKKSFTAKVAPHGVVMLKILHANGNE